MTVEFAGYDATLNPARLDEVAMEVKAWTLLNELSARIPSVRDVVASLSAIIVLSPVLILTAILIKLTAPGPIFFGIQGQFFDGER